MTPISDRRKLLPEHQVVIFHQKKSPLTRMRVVPDHREEASYAYDVALGRKTLSPGRMTGVLDCLERELLRMK